MSKYCLFLIVIYYLTGGNNSMSRFCKFGKLHVTKGNGMKKLVTLLLSLALVLSLAACGGEATPDASDDAPASSQNEESTENDNTEN